MSFNQSTLKDLSPLASCQKLLSLGLSKTKGVDESTLAKLTQVEKIFLNGAEIKDLAPLKALLNLKVLSVDKNAFPEGALTGFANPQIEIRVN